MKVEGERNRSRREEEDVFLDYYWLQNDQLDIRDQERFAPTHSLENYSVAGWKPEWKHT